MLSKSASVVVGDAVICALFSGTGTRDDVNGVAPAENGTLGLFDPLIARVPLPNSVMNDPAKNKLDCDAFVVMDETSRAAPTRPPNRGADHDEDTVLQTATPGAGDVKRPPAQTFCCVESQKSVRTSAFGPPVPRAANAPDEGVYVATLLADTPPREVKLPAT